MVKILCLILNAAVCIHFASAQAKTAWSAANSAMGLGTTSPPDPTDHQINLAIVGINNARTELEAAQAAAAIYNPALDMSDNVKQALENKVRQLRTPAGWTHPIPPPLPFGFDVMHIIMSAYYGTATAAPAAGPPAPQAPAGPQPGPPTAIRRGPSPGVGYAPGGAMTGVGGLGTAGGIATGPMSYMEPTNWEVELAIHNIHAAKTEAEAAKAAAAVYRIGLDTPDGVVNAFQDKVAYLRNPGWTGRGVPPLPRSFRPLSFIVRAFRQLQEALQASAAAQSQPAAGSAPPGNPPPPPPPPPGNNRGPMPLKKSRKPPPSRAQVERQLQLQEQQQGFGSGPNRHTPRYQTNSPPRSQPRYNTNSPPRRETSYRQTMNAKRRDKVDPFLSGPEPNNAPPPPTPKPKNLFANVKKQNKAPPSTVQNMPPAHSPISSSNNALPKPASVSQFNSKTSASTASEVQPPASASFRQESSKPKSPTKRLLSRYPGLEVPQPQPVPDTPQHKPPGGLGEISLLKSPVPTFTAPEKRPISSPPEKSGLRERYPGLIFENKENPQSLNEQLKYMEMSQPANKSPSADVKTPTRNHMSSIPIPQTPEVIKPKPAKKSSFKRSQQIWSPMGILGLGIDNILISSSDGAAESVPIPTKSTRPPPTTTTSTTTTTTTATTTTTTTTPRPTEPPKAKFHKSEVSKSKTSSPTDASATKASTQLSSQDKLRELENLLRGISPGELETLVNIIKSKAGAPSQGADQGPPPSSRDGSRPPYDQSFQDQGPPPPSRDGPRPPYDQSPRNQGPPPGFIPPPPGSQNEGPPREMMRGPPPQGPGPRRGPPPPGRRGPNGAHMSDGPGGPPGSDNMPPWARNGPNMNGPPMGGPPPGMGRGGPGGMGGPNGNLDPNNPQIARLIRVISKRIPDMLAGRTGGANNPAAGEAPEQPEGGAMNPLMMAMMMNGGGGGGGSGGADLSALFGMGGGSGGGNPLASMLGGGGGMGGLGALGGGGGSQLDMLQAALAGPSAPLSNAANSETAQAAESQSLAMQLLNNALMGGQTQGEGQPTNSGNPMAMLQALQGGSGGGGGSSEMGGLLSMLGGGGGGSGGGMGSFGAFNLMNGLGFGAV